MEMFPQLKFSVMNGWIPLVVFYVPFAVLMIIFPRDVVRKLYDRTGWYSKNRIFSIFGRIITFALLILLIFSPLIIQKPAFLFGLIIYLAGFLFLFISLFNFRSTPSGEPVKQGLYKISRNPQWVGLALITLGCIIMCGSGLLLLFFLITLLSNHFRIIGEEEACLQRYGESYQSFMQKVPRYFVFF
ncbi:MAG: hypothetical protein JEZ06_10300 [Anaerolineaceae bacterium]|nr:hypothetical protein [Anaerolineaceae bacterium]